MAESGEVLNPEFVFRNGRWYHFVVADGKFYIDGKEYIHFVVADGNFYIEEITEGGSMVKEIVPGHEYECIDAGAKVVFQNGAVPDVGRNGWQNEEMLEVMISRINFLNNMFPCRENAITITKLEEALLWQQKRTNDRKLRGVEGKHEV